MARTNKFSLSFPSSLEYLDALQGVAESLASVAGFGDEGRLDLGLAVREGVINAMKHGNRLDPSIPVRLSFHITESEFKVSIVDRGEGFEPRETPDPTSSENIWRTSGRGLLLIRSLVNEVRYRRRKRGMELVLTKYIPRGDAGEAAL